MSMEATSGPPTLHFEAKNLTCTTVGKAYQHPLMVQFLQKFNDYRHSLEVTDKKGDITMERLKHDPDIAQEAYDFFMQKLVLSGTNVVLDRVKTAALQLLASASPRKELMDKLASVDYGHLEFTEEK